MSREGFLHMLMKNSFLNRCFRTLPAVGFVLLLVQPVHAADSLDFFKNYFVTGDYAAKGVGLRGTGSLDQATGESLAQGTITIPSCGANDQIKLECVPTDATIIAAFLYWETIEKTNLADSAKGYALKPAVPPPLLNCSIAGNTRCAMLGKPLGNDHATPC